MKYDTMTIFVLCFGKTKLKQDKNRVFGQSAFPVAEELLLLEFKVDIENAHYICRSCVQLLKKRRGILNNVHRINCAIQEKYTTKPCTSGCVDNISAPFLSMLRKKVILDTNSPVEIDNLYSHECFEYSPNLLIPKTTSRPLKQSNPLIHQSVSPVILGCQTQ